MAIGDITEMPSVSLYDEEIQVFCTWQETGSRPAGTGTRPTYSLVGVRILNDTDGPATLLLTAPDGTEYWYQVTPPGTAFNLTDDQRAKLATGVSISVTGQILT